MTSPAWKPRSHCAVILPGSEDERCCQICLEDFSEKEQLRKLHCGHHWHVENNHSQAGMHNVGFLWKVNFWMNCKTCHHYQQWPVPQISMGIGQVIPSTPSVWMSGSRRRVDHVPWPVRTVDTCGSDIPCWENDDEGFMKVCMMHVSYIICVHLISVQIIQNMWITQHPLVDGSRVSIPAKYIVDFKNEAKSVCLVVLYCLITTNYRIQQLCRTTCPSVLPII